MPVEIKELIIRTQVTDGVQAKHEKVEGGLSPIEKRKIIDTCIREVLRQVQNQDER